MLLKILSLIKKFDAGFILDHINLTMEAGDILSLIGPSGSGKTTLLKCIAGLEQFDGGTVILNEKDVTDQKADQRHVVMMFQQPLLFPHMSVMENIVYGLRIRRMDKREILDAGNKMLKKIELTGYGDRFPYELSGGQQQRIALARSLIMKPQLLLLDEPFASLDPELRGTIRNWVRNLLKEEGVSAIFVTHDKEEAMMMGDRLAVIIDGRLLQEGTPLEVYKKPKNRLAAEFFSDGLVLDDDRFISVDKISLMPIGAYSHQKNLHSFHGSIKGKWIRAGQNMYQIDVPDFGEELVMLSSDEFRLKEQVRLLFFEDDIYFFPSNGTRL